MYHSNKCFRDQRKLKIKKCEFCEKEYKPKTQRKLNFCSWSCYIGNKHKHANPLTRKPDNDILIPCPQCNTEFKPKRNNSKFCSRDCQHASLKTSADLTEHRRELNKKFCAKYYARKRLVMVDKITLPELIKRDKSICHICGKLTSCKYSKYNKYSPTIDHIIPLIKGGLHTWDNVGLAHLSCNSKKRHYGKIPNTNSN